MYLLSKRWWQSRRAINYQGWDWRLTSPRNRDRKGITKMQQMGMKWSIDVTWVFIHKEDERQKNSPDAAVYLSILLLLYCELWTIQAITMRTQWFNVLPHYICTLVVTITLYNCTFVDTLSMLDDTQINSLQNEPDKYDNIYTVQYMESNK